MNRLYKEEDFMMYVERRLTQWSKWYSSGNYYGLGFHSESIEYVLMTVGIMIKSTGPKPAPCNEKAEEIEMLVTEMACQNKKIAMALRSQYFGRGMLTERAKRLGVSYPQFKIYVDMARQWLAGRLSANH
jgi:hypothetical protein